MGIHQFEPFERFRRLRGPRNGHATNPLQRSVLRGAERGARVASRRGRWRRRGQTLIIFTLTFTTLLAILGLAIDSVRVYNLYARMQRAAEAGALAGVIYMPNFYAGNLPYAPGDSGICRALQEVAKDGFGPNCTPGHIISAATACPTPVSSVEIAVCPVGGKPYDMQVFITETINVVFLSALGVGPVQLTAQAQSEYLPPVSLGTDTTASSGGAGNWGGLGICQSYVYPAVPIDCDDTLRSFAASIQGPAELKQSGDAYVYCQEGPSYTGSADPSAQFGYPYTTFNGFPTNHPQYADAGLSSSHCGAGNPDQQPFTGPATAGSAHPGGYAYYIKVVQNGSSVWLWNAAFGPAVANDCTYEAPLDSWHWTCNGNTPVVPPGYFPGTTFSTDGNFANPNLYFATTYSLYSVPDLANPAGGALLATFTAWPYDNMSTNGCGSGQVLRMPSSAYPGTGTVATCVTSNCHYKWCPLGNQVGDATVPTPITLAPGDYRVMVESTSYTQPTNFALGWGQHIYNLEVCPPGSPQSPSGNGSCITTPATPPGYVGGWGDVSMLFDNTVEHDNCNPPCIGNSYAPGLAEFPLGIVPNEYAGLTLDVKLFNPGNIWPAQAASGSDAIAVIPPLPNVGGTSGNDPCSINPSQLSAFSYSFPAWERSGTAQAVASTAPALPALIAVQNSDRLYAGLWTDIYIQIPSTYTAGQWTLCTWATANLQSPDDPYSQQVMTIKVTALGQSPVHLVG